MLATTRPLCCKLVICIMIVRSGVDWRRRSEPAMHRTMVDAIGAGGCDQSSGMRQVDELRTAGDLMSLATSTRLSQSS